MGLFVGGMDVLLALHRVRRCTTLLSHAAGMSYVCTFCMHVTVCTQDAACRRRQREGAANAREALPADMPPTSNLTDLPFSSFCQARTNIAAATCPTSRHVYVQLRYVMNSMNVAGYIGRI